MLLPVPALAALVWGILGVGQPPATAADAPGPGKPEATDQSGIERLVGRWLRTDGSYVIEVRAARADGRLEASYFNPRPINVARAEWRRASDGLGIFIELRDVNYPGSTYRLRHAVDKDRLVGEYFLAVTRETFPVQFVRQPK
jgi:hypothetical protein